ncbi:hypothetical protein CkaCkLH20_08951 [Colletotrichum karsti]|uniref:Uncharacterized protein n=1 Tax=Colletotrichum karsti TaxID=1095194 RepID=A0A9P6HY90_9PEZI|nr:uncharacterized protein CkaCkLH20_08951 [Colletotrichum karsti]KAF9873492.1 hypothetical protein CkaCkLH20_08951 [Colletotrichum karsti]
MKFISIIAVLSSMSAFSAVLAAPTSDVNTSPAEPVNAVFKKKECPDDILHLTRGMCNGNSCKWAGVNYDCQVGTCLWRNARPAKAAATTRAAFGGVA